MRPPMAPHGQLDVFKDAGHAVHGVVHIGMNEGQELPWYLHYGHTPIIGFEPLPDVFTQCSYDFQAEIQAGLVSLVNIGLSDRPGFITLNVPRRKSDKVESTPSSSALPELFDKSNEDYELGRSVVVPVARFDDWCNGYLTPLVDALVIDVQGMELPVLIGCGAYLRHFKYLVVECSDPPIYDGEASAQEVINWLVTQGFRQFTPISGHNDICFIRE